MSTNYYKILCVILALVIVCLLTQPKIRYIPADQLSAAFYAGCDKCGGKDKKYE